MGWTVILLTLVFISAGVTQNLAPPCDRPAFDSSVDGCLTLFRGRMNASGHGGGCPWPGVKGIYNQLKYCVDDVAKKTYCRAYRSLTDTVFLEVHREYFAICEDIRDPPLFTLVTLIAPLTAVAFVLPLLCGKLATWNQEMGSSVGL